MEEARIKIVIDDSAKKDVRKPGEPGHKSAERPGETFRRGARRDVRKSKRPKPNPAKTRERGKRGRGSLRPMRAGRGIGRRANMARGGSVGAVAATLATQLDKVIPVMREMVKRAVAHQLGPEMAKHVGALETVMDEYQDKKSKVMATVTGLMEAKRTAGAIAELGFDVSAAQSRQIGKMVGRVAQAQARQKLEIAEAGLIDTLKGVQAQHARILAGALQGVWTAKPN